MAACQTSRYRWPRNLGEFLQDRPGDVPLPRKNVIRLNGSTPGHVQRRLRQALTLRLDFCCGVFDGGQVSRAQFARWLRTNRSA